MAAVAQAPASVPTAPPASVKAASTETKEDATAAPDEKPAVVDANGAGPSVEVTKEDGDKKRATSSEKETDGAKSPSSRFDLEPNPFEQSFSRGSQSQDRTTPPRGGDATSIKHNALPPLSSLTSPAAADPTQFPWLAGQSLRSGPLSPAMLAGPAQSNQANQNNSNNNGNQAWGPATENAATSEESFEPGNFRTGFTPGTGSGFTPGYNALLNPGFGNLPMPSPNTAAFLANIASVTTENGDQQSPPDQRQPQPPAGLHPTLQGGPHGMSHLNPAHQSAETITPGTLNAIASDLNRQPPPPGMAPAFYPGMPPQPGMVPGMPPADYAQQNANAASQAANGLFLLSQAHQELSKREEEAKSTPPMSKRGAPPSAGSVKAPAGQKRKEPAGKGNAAAKKSKKSPEIDFSADDSDTDSKKSGGEKRSRNETEEEKRKNFLERNRQAALKCRQRKKAWLNELQNKVETLTMDNERLVHNVRGLEEEVNRLTSILMNHRDCGLGMPPMQPAYGRPLR
ncbi:hypothetical protein CC85DRAFT_304474 [Cutaneotrichosporon oleaginosum]|uniref:BZIP domain-containing protein n=1 Tax=Cutaneotrichosporon oleaginosum TaxID=879819 RepID=A0A0J0XG88_9TREE|nr:uncharacterized protein CC85DRAFT_304474 [Cutaneotrichosporon oleaginosum]KLT40073.1 hypothetical protein CC85DRAFT_304474 [Cutaneotrichosporon oleaginosum]TXT10407.1 hypothetical protein COLE_04341 [Cutaneotrichosporon oleaginosum]